MASSVVNALRPKPFRGDVVAAGVVVLATLVWLVDLRFDGVWATGVRLAVAAVAWAFVTAMAALAPMEGASPRAYQSVLYLASVALWIAVLGELLPALGARSATATAGDATVSFGLIGALAFAFATRRNSAVCTLAGALAGGVAVLAAVNWIFGAATVRTDRWVLLALTAAFGIAAIGQRDRHLRHGVALVDAAGIAVLAMGLTLIAQAIAEDLLRFGAGGGDAVSFAVGWGWQLVILAAGFGLVAYSSIDRQPGPAYLGVANLVLFALIAAGGLGDTHATLAGWPIVLAVIAAVLLAIGLRPTTPAPPPPDADVPAPPPLPLR